MTRLLAFFHLRAKSNIRSAATLRSRLRDVKLVPAAWR
jgi:hypothetical protein